MTENRPTHGCKQRKRFFCEECPAEEPFMSQNALTNHKRIKHDVAILCSVCEKSFTDAYSLDRHTRERHAEGGVELICDCGEKFNRKGNFDRHQKTCLLSKKGATIAIRTRFELLSQQMEDRNEACTLAFTQIREMAQKRRENVCTGCTKHFKNEGSLRMHKCRKQA